MTSTQLANDLLTAAENTSRIWLTAEEKAELVAEFGKKIDEHRAPLVRHLRTVATAAESEFPPEDERHGQAVDALEFLATLDTP